MKSPHANAGNRIAYINDEALNTAQKFRGNKIHTAKYTLLSFLPKNLMEQFRRVANVYFLVLSILTSMPFSPKNPVSLISTFTLVLLFSAMKEAYEDYQRHLSDREINSRPVDRILNDLNPHENSQPEELFTLKSIRWQDLEVGNLILLHNNDEVPADCVLLGSSDTSNGVCSIDSANLDGESNLKTFYAVGGGLSSSTIKALTGRIEYESPSPSLTSFRGTLHMTDSQPLHLTLCQLLLRGCTIRNTKWAVGIVIYAGLDTKSFLNGSTSPYKSSSVMASMNRCLYFVFFLQGILCVINATASLRWSKSYSIPGISNANGGEAFFTFLVAYSNLIPISLYVGIEIIKLIQKYLIEQDLEINGTTCRTSNLVDELGQVQYVFTDKTGTLTCNEMALAACAIVGSPSVYCFDQELARSLRPPNKIHLKNGKNHIPRKKSKEKSLNETNQSLRELSTRCGSSLGSHINTGTSESLFDLSDRYLTQDKKFKFEGSEAWIALHNPYHENRIKLLDFWLCLALCHSVAPEANENDDISMKNIMSLRYQASSPDEGAMVLAARHMGIILQSRSSNTITISNHVNQKDENYKILHVLEFTSTRRRMSVIVETPQGTLRIFIKGADTAILKRLKNGTDLIWIKKQLKDHAERGLRTLCIAVRDITKEEYINWYHIWQNANIEEDSKRRDELLINANILIENNFELLGMTAIEDRLQDGVPDTINGLLNAGIHVWVLTGDKEETAINIGLACLLIKNDSRIHRLSQCKSENNLFNILSDLIENKSNTSDVLVIDGDALILAFLPSLSKLFLQVASRCRACICCRVSPKQKAQVVQLVRDNISVITLAIGDGANDVSMIQTAHLGIGISGHEGTQAVRASDYSIHQFRYLRKLLFVHGAWAYHRICKFILFYFYKNMLVVFTEYYFAWNSGFSGQIYFPDWLSLGYNALFTSYPCVVGFSLDQHISSIYANQFPKLYTIGQTKSNFNEKLFLFHILLAIYHSLLCYYIPQIIHGSMDHTIFSQWLTSVTSFICVILVITIRMLIKIHSINYYVIFITIFSIFFDIIIIFILSTSFFSKLFQPQMNSIAFLLFNSIQFYFIIWLTITISFLTDLSIIYIQKQFLPTPQDIVNEMEYKIDSIQSTTISLGTSSIQPTY